MMVVFSSVLNLRDIFTSGTENDAMDQSEQMIQLWFGKFQFQCQNELDDRQIEGYHENGTSPFIGNCVCGEQQFLDSWTMSFFYSVIRQRF